MCYQKEVQSVASSQALSGSPIPREDPLSEAVSTAWGARFPPTTLFSPSMVEGLGVKCESLPAEHVQLSLLLQLLPCSLCVSSAMSKGPLQYLPIMRMRAQQRAAGSLQKVGLTYH